MMRCEEAAREEWGANPGRKPHDYACEIDIHQFEEISK